ncbi:MAG TPA: phosphoesterase [Desulfobulbaceae bacterium]|nr:phosphoesterase [Desulfobulbaceae bacterium]
MCVDLHLHSLYSDGSATPLELVEIAAGNKLAGIALTDHDTVEGIAEILAHGCNFGLAVIPGLEVSSTHRKLCLHILGYGIDHTSNELRQWLAPLQRSRQERNEKIIAKMRQMGLDVHVEELRTISCCGQTGRPHIARLLLNKGIVESLGQAFHQFLRRGAPAWFSRFTYSAAESIDMIHRAGGLAVLAHPGQLDPDLKFLPLLIPELVERGLDGLEVQYPSHPAELQRRLRTLARKYNLVVTGGSDYHGKNKNMSVMAGGSSGFCPPDTILAALAERIALRAFGAEKIRTGGTAG